MRRFTWSILAGLIVLTLAACGDSDSPTEDDAAPTQPSPIPGGDTTNAAETAGYRVIGIESCAEIEPIVAPLLTHGQSLQTDEVQNSGYPSPLPYQFRCVYAVGDETEGRFWIEGYGEYDEHSLDDIRMEYSQQNEVATDENAIVFEEAFEHERPSSYFLHLASPQAPAASLTGSLRLEFEAGGWGAAAAVPPEDAIVDTLLNLLEPAD